MWTGGVRVIIRNADGRVLLVRQSHDGRDIWMLPGGMIEDGENAAEAAVREVFEETGLKIRVGPLIWHAEEVSTRRGSRFVNFFLAEAAEGRPKLGSDPELDAGSQVMRELGFFSREEAAALPELYPAELRSELWDIVDGGAPRDAFRVRGQGRLLPYGATDTTGTDTDRG
jgi:ADP-ribose pyrophosphatase YjhB (NUDIX family)